MLVSIPRIVSFFQSDLITILIMKDICMGNVDDYEYYDGVYLCFDDSLLFFDTRPLPVNMFHRLQQMLPQK